MSKFKSEVNPPNPDFLFTAVSSTTIIPGIPYQITTTLEEKSTTSSPYTSLPVTFIYKLTSKKDEVIAQSPEIQFSSPGQKTTALEVPSLLEDSYNLLVTATDSSGKTTTDKATIMKNDKNHFILIQTDKGIYKPGETVRFRVFLLNRFMQPFEEDKLVDVKIFDPEQSIKKQWKRVIIPKGKGFISDFVELSEKPHLGDWKIQAKTDKESETTNQKFKVDEYVLPKHKVELKCSPSFVTFEEPKFTVEVTALDNHGKPVGGEVTVELKDPHGLYKDGEMKPRSITKTTNLEEGKGQAKLEFDAKAELNITKDEVYKWGKDLQIEVSCKDKVTGNVMKANGDIRMHQFPFKIELVSKPNYITPGFPVDLVVKVATLDNIPICDEREDALKIEHGFAFDIEGGVEFKPIPQSGLVPLTLMAAPNPKVAYESLDVTYKNLKESLWLPGKVVNPMGSYILVKKLTEKLLELGEVEINVKTSKEYKALNLFLVSKGVLIHFERVEGEGKDTNLKIKLPPKSSPKSKLFIYIVFNDNTIVSDGLDLVIEPDGRNKLEVELNKKEVEPREEVTISLRGHPNSVVGLRAVDQSMLALKKDDDLSQEKLRRVFDLSNMRGSWNEDPVVQNFNQHGFVLLTNLKRKANIDETDEEGMEAQPCALFSDESGGRGAKKCKVYRSSAGDGMEEGVRSIFPETWLWEDLENLEGSLSIQRNVPDTMTSWILSAFQINQLNGLDLCKETQKLTVFRTFFISLNLPYSIVQGEVLLLQVMVHNYQDAPIKAKVTLENSDDLWEVLEAEVTKEVDVNPNSVSLVQFPISSKEFGLVNLKVKGSTSNAADAICQTLIVRPPGIKHSQTTSVFVDLLDSPKFKKENISAVLPQQRVPEADELTVEVVGDILEGALDNVEGLLKRNHFTGESDMLTAISILDYLEISGAGAPEVEAMLKLNLEESYKQQVENWKYFESNQNQSQNKQMPSTWTASWIARNVILARRHISVDEEFLKKLLKFLLSQQNDDGSFVEEGFENCHVGKLAHFLRDLQLDPVTITAHCLLTVAEATKAEIDLVTVNSKGKTAAEILESGVNFILREENSNLQENNLNLKDPYRTNLISYLLHYVNHSKKDDFFKLMEDTKRLDTSEGTIHWEVVTSQKQRLQKRHTFWDKTVAMVDATSLGLQTYLLRGKEKLLESVSIVRWLMKQNNNSGALTPWKVTLAVPGLCKFASEIHPKAQGQGQTNAEARIRLSTGSDGNDSLHEFQVRRENRAVVQEYIVQGGVGVKQVTVEGEGSGTALTRITWSYYVNGVGESNAFDLKTELEVHNQGRNLDMKLAFAYLTEGVADLAILEVNTPSGYIFDQEELDNLKNGNAVMRYELKDKHSKVQIYFESVGRKTQSLTLKAYRVQLMAKLSRGVAKIYNYYDNTQVAENLYDVDVIPVNIF